MDHAIRCGGGHQGVQALAVLKGQRLEAKRLGGKAIAQPLQPGLFEGGVVVIVEVVEAHHSLAPRQQGF